MKPVTIDTNYSPLLNRRGLPYRLRGSSFSLKSVLKNYNRGDDVIGWREQTHQYKVARSDDPGWLCYILSNSTLDSAKHIAANIMQAYADRELEVQWVKTLDGFKYNHRISLYILDALFVDDTAYRRSQFYETLLKIDGPETSAILLGQSQSTSKFINFIGLKPHLLLNVK